MNAGANMDTLSILKSFDGPGVKGAYREDF